MIIARKDCLQYSERDILGRSIRPTKDTLSISPSGHFYIHYDTTGNAAPNLKDDNENGIPDYIDFVGSIADSAHYLLIEVLGFQEEPYDGDGGYDIYIMSYGAGSYGFNYLDSGGSSYLQIDNDYIGYDSKFELTPLQIMQITVAHEYFHAIQWGYEANLSNNKYFYEMSSMWFEDVIIPNGNDYLDGWVEPLLNSPDLAINNIGDGYELALFGHYLSSFIDQNGFDNIYSTTIIRDIWEKYSTSNLNPLESMEYVLINKFNQNSFIEAWMDFMTRNLFNGIDSTYYYYSDQELINPLYINRSIIDDSLTISIPIDNTSLNFFSLDIKDYISILEIKHDAEEYFGNFILVNNNSNQYSYRNSIATLIDTTTNQLNSDDNIYLVYAKKENLLDTLSLKIVNYTVPIPPTSLTVEAAQDSMLLNWLPSPGPGDSLFYIIFRNDDSIYTSAVNDTFFIDKNGVNGSSMYKYYIKCKNNIGASLSSNIVMVESWPEINQVNKNEIISIYPNPVRKEIDKYILFSLNGDYFDYGLQLINIKGQVVHEIDFNHFGQGWHRQKINQLFPFYISSGIYFVSLNSNKKNITSYKIIIFP